MDQKKQQGLPEAGPALEVVNTNCKTNKIPIWQARSIFRLPFCKAESTYRLPTVTAITTERNRTHHAARASARRLTASAIIATAIVPTMKMNAAAAIAGLIFSRIVENI